MQRTTRIRMSRKSQFPFLSLAFLAVRYLLDSPRVMKVDVFRPGFLHSIIRIIFMVPIYSCVSFLSYAFYQHAIYYEVLRDCYEAFAIASFFALLCYYIAPDLSKQKDHFRAMKPKDWLWPLSLFKKWRGGDGGMWRRPRSGLTWFNVCLGL
jgi:Organic solute transporter Ostalpha